MYRLYYEDEFLYESNDPQAVYGELQYHLKNVLKKEAHYFRLVPLDPHRVMIDYGSHVTFYYVLNDHQTKPYNL